MSYYAGIDVSLETSSVCVIDSEGAVVREAKVVSEPEALTAFFSQLDVTVTRIGLEAGPLSQWLYADLREAGFAVELLETRQVADAFRSMPVKTDRTDARGIAQMLRLGWFRPVHCKSVGAQEARALLTARRQMRSKRHDIEMAIRGILRGFGIKLGKTTPKTFEPRVRELTAEHPTLTTIVEALLRSWAVLEAEFRRLDNAVHQAASADPTVRLLTSAPGVGAVVALTYKTAVDDPDRFRSSREVGAHFGLTPRKYQSGRTDRTGRISKVGDHWVRVALYEAGNVLLTRPVKGGSLKRWGLAIARRCGMKKAKVAVARKLAVILHRMMADGTAYQLEAAA